MVQKRFDAKPFPYGNKNFRVCIRGRLLFWFHKKRIFRIVSEQIKYTFAYKNVCGDSAGASRCLSLTQTKPCIAIAILRSSLMSFPLSSLLLLFFVIVLYLFLLILLVLCPHLFYYFAYCRFVLRFFRQQIIIHIIQCNYIISILYDRY